MLKSLGIVVFLVVASTACAGARDDGLRPTRVPVLPLATDSGEPSAAIPSDGKSKEARVAVIAPSPAHQPGQAPRPPPARPRPPPR